MRIETPADYALIRGFLIRTRNIRYLNRQEVAERMRTGRSTVHDLETGHIRDPRLGTLVRWAGGLEFGVDLRLLDLRSPQRRGEGPQWARL